MLLAVDCGNTNIVFALYNGDVKQAIGVSVLTPSAVLMNIWLG